MKKAGIFLRQVQEEYKIIPMLTGISTYTYTWAVGVPGSLPASPMSVHALIRKAVEFQVGCIQVADNLPLVEQPYEELKDVRTYARMNGILVEIGGRGLTDENLEKHIGLAAFFSSHILRMVIDSKSYKPDIDTILAVIRNATGRLGKERIVLAVENHDRLHSSVFREIVERSGSEWVGICLDSVNSMGIGEGMETVVQNLAPYTVNLHVKDYTVRRVSHNMGFVVEGVPAGKGMLNLPHLLEKLSPYNMCKSAILELWTPPAATIEETIQREETWAAESIQYIKDTIAKR
jgi:sugar phosphate isomerase/epimerase